MGAAGIEPALETDTSTTLPEQKPYTNDTPAKVCEELLYTFHTLSGQKRDTFLRAICEIYVKWCELPSTVRAMVERWESLPDEVKERIQRLVQQVLIEGGD